jgi:glyoxalase superfamily protein
MGASVACMATHWTIGGDAADPHRLAEFWAAALGYILEPGYDDPDGASIVDPDDVGPAIGFLRVPEPKTSKNRLHIDIRVAGPGQRDAASAERMRTKAAALVELGATQVREDFYGPELGHIVMLDPEGNEFCVG